MIDSMNIGDEYIIKNLNNCYLDKITNINKENNTVEIYWTFGQYSRKKIYNLYKDNEYFFSSTPTFVLYKSKKDKEIKATGFFKQLFWGKEDAYYYVPIVSNEKKNDSIIVQKFIDEGLSERQAYHISQLAVNPITSEKF